MNTIITMIIITIKAHSNDNDNIDNNNNNNNNNNSNDNNHLLVTLSLFCRICLAFSFTFHVSCFFVKDLDLAVDSTIQRVSKERSICCAKLRSVAKIHHRWIRCWRPGGIGEGGKGMTGARLSGSEFFFCVFLGASLWRSKRRLWFQLKIREWTKSWTVFDWFVPKRRCCFKRGVQCLQPLETNRYRNLWCPRRGC